MPDLSQLESAELLVRYRGGDENAAAEVFGRYVERLTLLARARLSPRLARRTDPEDIVLSAWRSFFVGARDGRFEVARSGELWPLLVTITLRKLYRNVKHHTAERRSVDAEQSPNRAEITGWDPVCSEPRPEHAVALADELEAILRGLGPFERRVMELCLQGESVPGIAAETGRPERTVRRAYSRVRDLLFHRLEGLPQVPAAAAGRQIPLTADPNRHSSGSAIGPAPPKPHSPRERRARFGPRAGDPQAPLAYSDYLLQRQIGAGRMGKVYQALDRRSSTLVAVKFLRKSFLRQPRAVERFATEARIVGDVRHPGIVGLHGLGRTPHGGYFIVMDLLERGDLAAAITRGRIPVADAVRWTAEACAAMEHAHSHGIVHCDLKPSNLLLDADGHVRVTDFGLARSMADAQTLGEIAGTAPFMAPEQVSDAWGPVTPVTDVYGLGAVLYALLTGRPPFDGSRISDVLSLVVSARPVRSPRWIRRSIPAMISDICRRCLVKRPSDRYRSAAELRDELLAALVDH